ncbi:MAG TPA: DUF1559 domain-containing protein [Chthoniobacteraceae bacterium]|nr:DUF1559 domain-containing protein [Chthoniobacteraceae bacterium]
MPAPSRQRAATLLELLLAVLGLALLLALLLPVFQKVRETTATTRCTQNLRQIGVALHLYALDHQNRYPPPYDTTGNNTNNTSWRSRLQKHSLGPPTGSFWKNPVWKCPEAKGEPVDRQHYGMNYYIFNQPWDRRVQAPAEPSKYVIVGEIYANNEYFRPDRSPVFDGETVSNHRISHKNRSANHLFADGHVESLHPALPYKMETGAPWKWW